MRKLNIIILLFCVLVASCSESLEDTYKDYAGDGRIRYLAKCSDLTVKPGWERIELNWKNGIDNTVTNIRVRWEVDGKLEERILDKDATSLNVTDLKDGSYMFEVVAIDGNGNKSINVVNYGRPYTEAHEVVRTFTRAVVRHYKINDKLVMFMDKWSDKIEEIKLHYTNLNGEEQNVLLDEDFFNRKLAVISDINLTKEIKISRKGRVEGCIDLIEFSDYILGNEMAINSDLRLALRSRYGLNDDTPEGKAKMDQFLATTTELEFDYNLSTLENIMYCPNLKTIYLGKNRYLNENYLTPSTYSVFFEKDKTVEVLDFIIANNILDLKVKKYADHYLQDIERDYIIEMGIPELPNLNYLSEDMIKKTECSIPETPGHNSNLNHIFDNDPTTNWLPVQSGGARNFEINIELDKLHTIKGFMVRQRGFKFSESPETLKLLPPNIEITVSEDYLVWTSATLIPGVTTIGKGPGEVTLLPIATSGDVKYIRVKIVDQITTPGIYGCTLADFIPYF